MEVFTLNDLIIRNSVQRPNHVALEKGATTMTYAEIADQCERLAGFLHHIGVKFGDRVGIYMLKGFEEVIAMFALSHIGAVYVNINPQWKIRQLRHVVEDCGVRFLFTDSYRIVEIHQSRVLDDLECCIVVGDYFDHEKVVMYSDINGDYEAPLVNVIDSDTAALIYTSGSSGPPKGVVLSHLNIIHGARIVSTYLHNTETDRVLGLLPFSFDYGFSQVTTMFYCGGTVVLQSVVFPAEIVRTIVDKKITGFAGVPSIWIQLTRYLVEEKFNISSLRYITNSGGEIPKTILKQMYEQFQEVEIFLMYGLTEAFRSTYLPPQELPRKMGAIGRSIPNVDIFVVDPDKGLCGPGETGELIHRGSLICKGYWENDIATANKIKPCPYLEHLIGKEEVLYSGDIVRIDEDGYLWFIGRKDFMIKCSGHRVSPTEVEEVAYDSGFALNALAFGIPDVERGMAVHLALNLIDNDISKLEEIKDSCRANLPSYMVPKEIHALSVLFPLNVHGKFDRKRIIELCNINSAFS